MAMAPAYIQATVSASGNRLRNLMMSHPKNNATGTKKDPDRIRIAKKGKQSVKIQKTSGSQPLRSTDCNLCRRR